MNKKTILVADDDILVLKLITRILTTCGFEVLQAANGHEALKQLDSHQHNIALIITDYNMPNMDGLELANAVRSQEEYNTIPLILITANADITSLLGEQRNVFSEIINKPFSSELISTKVTALLGK